MKILGYTDYTESQAWAHRWWELQRHKVTKLTNGKLFNLPKLKSWSTIEILAFFTLIQLHFAWLHHTASNQSKFDLHSISRHWFHWITVSIISFSSLLGLDHQEGRWFSGRGCLDHQDGRWFSDRDVSTTKKVGGSQTECLDHQEGRWFSGRRQIR